MPAKKQRQKKPPVKDQHLGVREGIYISPQLRAALDAFLAATRPKPSKTETFKTALEEFLARKGFWPPGTA